MEYVVGVEEGTPCSILKLPLLRLQLIIITLIIIKIIESSVLMLVQSLKKDK